MMNLLSTLLVLVSAVSGHAADLSEKDSSGSTKVVGASGTGVESNFLEIFSDGSLSCRVTDSVGTGITSTTTSSGKTALDVFVRTGLTAGTSTNVAVSTSASTQVFAANTSARYRIIHNNSGSNLWCRHGQAAVAGQYLLIPTNSRFEWNVFNLWQGTVNCTSSATIVNTVNIQTFEGTL